MKIFPPILLVLVLGSGAGVRAQTNQVSEPPPPPQLVTPLPVIRAPALSPAESNALPPSALSPSRTDRIEITNDTAVAAFAPHTVKFAANFNGAGVIDFLTLERKRLRSHLLGLVYSCGATNVLLTDAKDSFGEVEGNSRVLYRNVFSNINASVIYTYTAQSLTQDLLLLSAPPDPESLGLNSSLTKLQIWTEFLSPPTPVIESREVPFRVSAQGTVEATAIADRLDFGTMSIGFGGRAFLVGTRSSSAQAPVAARWIQTGGRTFLVEMVDYESIRTQLQQLPRLAQNSRPPGSLRPRSVGSQLLFAARQPAARRGTLKLVAAATTPPMGLLLDYVISNNIPTSGLKLWVRSDTNYTLNGSTVSNWADLSGNTNDFKQATNGLQPEYVTNSINGRPVMRFDGTDDAMNTALTIPSNTVPNATLYTVERMRGGLSSSSSDLRAVWSTDGNVGNFQRARGFIISNFTVQLGPWGGFNDNIWQPAVGVETNTARIVGITFKTSDTLLYINGTSYNAGKHNKGSGSEPLRLGAGYSTLQNTMVDIAEMLVYDRELTGEERAQLENALNDRYNVFTNRLDPPIFSTNGGDYLTSLNVSLTNSTAGVTFQLSTTGELWTNYTAPITLTTDTTLLARSVKSGYAASYLVAQFFKFNVTTNQTIPTNGLKLWLKADSGVIFDGTNVSRWNDLSGNTNHETQSTLSYQPTYITNAYNGKPVIRFDGTNDMLDSVLTIPRSTVPNVTIYTVERPRTLISGYKSVWGTDGNVGGFQRGRGFDDTSFLIQNGSGMWTPGLATVTNRVRIVGVTYTTNNTYLFMDGATNNAGSANLGNASQPFRLGAGYDDGTQHSPVDLVEVLVYDHELSAADRLQLETALSYAYNLDSDGDGLPDGWELQQFGGITAYGANDDPDGDGWANLQEYTYRTNPTTVDTPLQVRITVPSAGLSSP